MNSKRTFSVKDRFLSRPSCKRVRAGVHNDIAANVVIGNNNLTSGTQIGFLTSGNNNSFTCNEALEVRTGFDFVGNNLALPQYFNGIFDGLTRPNFALNLMHDNNIGLHFNGGSMGSIGWYLPSLPAWTNAFDNKWSANGTLNTDVQVDNYNASLEAIVYQNGASGRPFKPVSLPNPATNMYPLSSPTGQNLLNVGIICDEHGVNLDDNQLVAPYPEDVAQMYKMVLADTTTQSAFDVEYKWMSEFAMFGSLEGGDTLREVDTLLAAFFDSTAVANMGLLHRSLKAVSSEDYTDGKTRSEIADYRDSLVALTPVIAPESALKDVLLTMIDIFTDTTTTNISGLDSLLLNIPDSLLTDTFGLVKNWTMDSTQKATLVSIASLCPLEYGFGVYLARNTLAVLDTSHVTYSDSCGISGGQFRLAENNLPSDNATQNIICKIYPNPSAGQYTLDYSLNKEDVGYLEVCDLLGKCVYNHTITFGTHEHAFELNQNEGVYIYKFIVNKRLQKSGKLILINDSK